MALRWLFLGGSGARWGLSYTWPATTGITRRSCPGGFADLPEDGLEHAASILPGDPNGLTNPARTDKPDHWRTV